MQIRSRLQVLERRIGQRRGPTVAPSQVPKPKSRGCKTQSPPYFRYFEFGHNSINLTAMRAPSGAILMDFHPQIPRKILLKRVAEKTDACRTAIRGRCKCLKNGEECGKAEEHSYSFCFASAVEESGSWHCRICRRCRDWREWHGDTCNRCTYGVSLPCERCGQSDGMLSLHV